MTTTSPHPRRTSAGQRPAQPGERRSPRRRNPRFIRAGHYILLVAVLILLVGPLVVPLLASFKSSGENLFGTDATVLPRHWSLHAYSQLNQQIPLVHYMLNSTAVATMSIVSNLVAACTAGYMLSRPNWRGRNAVFYVLTAAMMFPFESIMVSLFVETRNLGLVDTLRGAWLPGSVGVINILIMRAAFMAVPKEIEDAALLDGAREWTRFWRIFLPSSRGALTVVVLTTFIAAWDDFLWPLLVLRSDHNFTLMLGLVGLEGQFGFDYRVVLAGALAALLPVAIIFFATQRYFFRGVEEGGVKF
ncbi:ABC-type glycerol-3-phosphate transport system permease component [Catenulispora sp. MAP12-49]|uniref:carbohydrate ABC transporter permease n=1 Tax=Catenulispora sp. MAP12-49 TaxID=3156302 RepID=UPI00351846E2